MKTWEDFGIEIQLEEGNFRIDGKLIDGGWKPARKRLKENFKKGNEEPREGRVEEYRTKKLQQL